MPLRAVSQPDCPEPGNTRGDASLCEPPGIVAGQLDQQCAARQLRLTTDIAMPWQLLAALTWLLLAFGRACETLPPVQSAIPTAMILALCQPALLNLPNQHERFKQAIHTCASDSTA
jgi:hypothetical protein